jgi:protocatechuate 3,4-dioxygenase beta subunit
MTGQLGVDLLAHAADDGTPTDAEGRFTLTGIEGNDEFHVVAVHADFAAGIARNVRAGATDVRVELAAPARVTGRAVADEDGEPLPAFVVELQTTMFMVVQRPVRSETVTGAVDGAFAIEAVPPGSYSLVARAEGRSEAKTQLTVAPGAAVAARELRLPRGATVRGSVRGDDGAPVARALVRPGRGGMLDNPILAMMQGSDDSAFSDERGRFELGGLPPGRLQLCASARGWADGKSPRVVLEAGAILEGVEIVLDHGGSVKGVLRVGPGDRAEDFAVMAQEVVSQGTASCTPAADGSFRIDDLEPGRYQVQAMHPVVLSAMRGPQPDLRPGRSFDFKGMMSTITENIVSQRCVVRAGETTEVELDASELGAGTRVTLRVRIGGQPLREGVVEATLVADGRLRTGFLTDGVTTLGALQPGPLRVQVRAGMTLAPVGGLQDVEIPPGRGDHTVTIDLPGGELRGRVVDMRTGNPLEAVLVRLLKGEAADDDLLGSAITDGRGEFAFRALEPGTYGLVAADALLRRDEASAASRADGIRVAAGESVAGIELRAQPAAGVTVLVTDDANTPLPGAMLAAVDAEGRPLGFSLGISGQDGRAHLGGLPRGRMRVVGRAPGLAPDATDLVDLTAGASIDLQLRLRRGTRVVLDALARDGRPLPGADVTARCGSGPWFPAMLLVEGRGAGGRLELGRLAPGDWEFRVAHPAVGAFTVRRAVGDGATVTILATPP